MQKRRNVGIVKDATWHGHTCMISTSSPGQFSSAIHPAVLTSTTGDVNDHGVAILIAGDETSWLLMTDVTRTLPLSTAEREMHPHGRSAKPNDNTGGT